MPADPTGPSRGSAAVAAGLLTRGVLRGPRFRRVFPDVYLPATLDCDLAARSRAAAVLVAGRGVLAGYSAAEPWGASCGPADAPAEVLLTSPRCQSYRCSGLRVHRDRVGPEETTRLGGLSVTTPARTAFDLARWAPTLTEQVAAADALAHSCRLDLADVTALRHLRLGARRGGGVAEVLRLADRRAVSPMESRIRMALVLGGLPVPAVQHEVVVDDRRYFLDLAYPEWRIAIEYDGAEHRTQERARRDLLREAALVSAGWRVLRFDAHVVLRRPARIVAALRAALLAARDPR